MKFERCLRRVWCEPWLILPAMHMTISEVLHRHFSGKQTAIDIEQFSEGADAPAMSVRDGVATIPVRGVISKDISKMERMNGAVDVRDISIMLDAALADTEVRGIVLDVDSPGGTVQGVPELAARIAEVNTIKPVVAYTDGLMASAAYWLSAGASHIIASQSATVGSIGVYLALLDQSRAYEMAGYKVELIKSEGSPLKAAGAPGTVLSDDQRADLQASVDYLYSMFSGYVGMKRKRATAAAMRGQTFFGAQAMAEGLVDELGNISTAEKTAKTLGNKRFL
jgi:signal peptide peptidase SppA